MKLIDTFGGYVFVAAGSLVLRSETSGAGKVVTLRHDKCSDAQVVSMTATQDSSKLFVGYSNKCVVCYDLSTSESTAIATLRKQPTAIRYGSFTGKCLNKTDTTGATYEVVLASDKAGEVFALNAPHLKKQALLAGHTASVITDLALHTTSSGKQIVATSDRDEKVRISHFPDMENIHTFCLAHTNVVASVCLVEVNGQTLLLSTGWDHQLIVWDAMQGKALQSINFRPATSTAAASSSTAAVEEKEGGADEEDVDQLASAEVAEAAEGEDGEEDLEGKVYDELSAGNYPFKVVCGAAHSGGVTVAVLFKGSALLKVFALTAQKSGKVTLTEQATVTLAAVPVDVVFTAPQEIAALMPLPQGMQVFAVGAGAVLQEVTSQHSYVAALAKAATDLGVDFTRPDASADGNPTTGMKKHTLDKRFNTSENLQLRTGRGAKRSKRNKTEA